MSISTATCSLPKIPGRDWSSATGCSCPRATPAWVCMKRYLILAEGHSDDPHYGKTARGVIHYCPHPVVAVVDSARPGATLDGVPVVGSVEEGLALDERPTTALVGVAVAGGRLPPEWRLIIRSCIEAGLDVESGMHEVLTYDPELAEL